MKKLPPCLVPFTEAGDNDRLLTASPILERSEVVEQKGRNGCSIVRRDGVQNGCLSPLKGGRRLILGGVFVCLCLDWYS